jgi:hypothetical protein
METDHQPAKSPPEFCHDYRGHFDGENIHGHYGGVDGIEFIRDAPVVSIEEARFVDDPAQPRIHLKVQVKNLGYEPVSIPWITHPVEPGFLKQDDVEKTTGYELLTIDFSLGSPFQQDPVLSLQREVALFAQPGNAAQHLKLAHVQWAELDIEQSVICRDSDSKGCQKRLHEPQRVSALWYSRTLQETYRNGCIIESGAYTDSEFVLGPVELTGNFPSQ